VSNTADTAIRTSTAAVVLAVAGIAAYISYWHAYAVVRQYGESGVTALLEPGTIDGLVYASSMVILHAARHRLPVPRLVRWMLALGIAASLAVNVAQGWSHGLVGAAAAAWPAVVLVGSYELLAWMIRTTVGGGPDHVPAPDHGVPGADQPGTVRQPAPPHEAVMAAGSRDGAGREPETCMTGCTRRAWSPRSTEQDQANQPARTRRTMRAGQPGKAPDHVNQAGRWSLDRPSPRRQPATSMPLRSPPTAPASGKESRLSERKLAEAFGKTSRRWARNRMAEAKQEPVAG
jgi:hypothetical protein